MRDSTQHWQTILAKGFATSSELLQFLELPTHASSNLAEQSFKTRVPLGFAKRMEPGNPLDPLLLQVLASQEELNEVEGYEQDPLKEMQTNPIPGLIHKYNGRVLLTVTGTCPIHCRYCFRRHFPYQANNPGRLGWRQALDYIANDSSIQEVIFSGGEPLMASDILLRYLFTEIRAIQHIRTIRIHTRIPIVLPERINEPLLQMLQDDRVQTVIVLHSNHPNEINIDVEKTCITLREKGCFLLNQSVLLKQVNDNASILATLSHRLFECGVLPYYLHQLDHVNGAHHFEVSFADTHNIYSALQASLPGYLVPKLVKEVAGEKNKILVPV